MSDVVPAAHANPFAAVGLLLSAVRSSMEGSKRPDQAPRWVRIDRVRQFVDPKTGDADAIASGVMKAMGVVTLAIAYMQRFTLDATDLLVQGDAAKALVEVSADLVKQATSKEFINALEIAVGQEPSAGSPISGVADIIDKIVDIADKVPEPDDLKVIGAQIYALLAIEQLTTGAVDDTTAAHVDISKTGKLRLLHWGFWQAFKLQNLGKGKSPVDVFTLGARRLPDVGATKVPLRARGTFGEGGSVETVYDSTSAAPTPARTSPRRMRSSPRWATTSTRWPTPRPWPPTSPCACVPSRSSMTSRSAASWTTPR